MTKREHKIEHIKDFVFSVIDSMGEFVPMVRAYRFQWKNEEHNGDNDFYMISYDNLNFEASFFVYEGLLDRVSDPLTVAEQADIRRSLAHEYGHCFIFDLFGKLPDKERAATWVGDLLLELLDRKEGRIKSDEKKEAVKMLFGKV